MAQNASANQGGVINPVTRARIRAAAKTKPGRGRPRPSLSTLEPGQTGERQAT
jgi:hypothetical protein